MKPLHVIVGAGQIGPLLAERLLAKGMRVRMIRRGQPLEESGIEIVSANVSDPNAAAEAMRGASVVYHCANPLYDRWDTELVPLAKGIAAGAARAGARLVVLDNLYMYDPSAGPMRPDSANAPRSKKGHFRVEAADAMLAAHARGEVPVAIARAADFFGPRVGRSLFGERFWPRLFANKTVEVMGDPDQPHTYSYAPDVADGLLTLGEANDDAFGRVWHLPALPAESTRTWVERFARAANRSVKMSPLSPTLLRIAGLFMREAGELPEMMYQWRTPFVLDDSDFRATFKASPTQLDRAVRDTVKWAAQRYDPAHVASGTEATIVCTRSHTLR
jgi:nucleoside-diphosphate-sugar epimerase